MRGWRDGTPRGTDTLQHCTDASSCREARMTSLSALQGIIKVFEHLCVIQNYNPTIVPLVVTKTVSQGRSVVRTTTDTHVAVTPAKWLQLMSSPMPSAHTPSFRKLVHWSGLGRAQLHPSGLAEPLRCTSVHNIASRCGED